jgi:hypothetical protein
MPSSRSALAGTVPLRAILPHAPCQEVARTLAKPWKPAPRAPSKPPLRLYLTGRVSAERDGRVVDEKRLPGRQGPMTLVYLALERARPVPIDELADAIWGEEPPRAWESALSAIVSKLRSALGDLGLGVTTRTTARSMGRAVSGSRRTRAQRGRRPRAPQGERRGTGRMFFRVPVGAELCGPAFTPDDSTLFLAVQHPATDGVKDWAPFGRPSTFEDPATRWPDFEPGMPPRRRSSWSPRGQAVRSAESSPGSDCRRVRPLLAAATAGRRGLHPRRARRRQGLAAYQ